MASVALIVAVGFAAEASDTYFRITYRIDRSGPGEIRLIGRIFNESSLDASNVRLRVQALDAMNNVVSEPSAFVDRIIRARSEGYWEASVAPDPRISGYRVTVAGYRFQVHGP